MGRTQTPYPDSAYDVTGGTSPEIKELARCAENALDALVRRVAIMRPAGQPRQEHLAAHGYEHLVCARMVARRLTGQNLSGLPLGTGVHPPLSRGAREILAEDRVAASQQADADARWQREGYRDEADAESHGEADCQS